MPSAGVSATQLADTQKLLTQLEKALPPAQWQSENATLEQAARAVVGYLTAVIHAIDAGNVNQFQDTAALEASAESRFCAPVAQLNADPSQLFPPLIPLNSNLCAATTS